MAQHPPIPLDSDEEATRIAEELRERTLDVLGQLGYAEKHLRIILDALEEDGVTAATERAEDVVERLQEATEELSDATVDVRTHALQRRDDPRAVPEAPETPKWAHRAEEWPEELDRARYLVKWTERRDRGDVRCRWTTRSLSDARRRAQELSLSRTSLAVSINHEDLQGGEELVDLWAGGLWLEPHLWTKEGEPPVDPDAETDPDTRPQSWSS